MYSIENIKAKLPSESRLTPIGFDYSFTSKSGKVVKRIRCECRCGNITIVLTASILNGNTYSCGCHKKELPKNHNVKFKPYIKRLYGIWRTILYRCYDPTSDSYKYYGAKGVIMCDEWKNNYQSFLDWSIQNGYEDHLEIDKDIKGNGLLYSPETCCWVDHKSNCRNKTNSRKFNFNNQLITLPEISQITNVPLTILTDRIYAGKKSINDAVYLPIRKRK